MGRIKREERYRGHIRLVEPAAPSELPPIVTDPKARKEFELLTQALVDIAIEITDVLHGDPDLEDNGDEEPNGDEEADDCE